MARGLLGYRLTLSEASRSELEYFVETQLRMSKSVEVQSPINFLNLIISSLLSSNFLVCLFSLHLFTYTKLKVFLEMLVWHLTVRIIH